MHLQSPFNKIIERCILAVAFMIPFAKKFVPALLILLGLLILIRAIKCRFINRTNPGMPLTICLVIFLLHLLGLTYSEHIDDGLNEIGIKLSYILFPALALLSPAFDNELKAKAIDRFVYGCLAFIPVAIAYGIYRSVIYDNPGYLSYQELGINFHPTYAATYQAWALFAVILKFSRNEFLFGKKWISYAALLIMPIFISMLASKAGIIAGLMTCIFAAYVLIREKYSVSKALALNLGIAIISIMAARMLPGSSSRIDGALQDVKANTEAISETTHEVSYSSTALRMVTWSASWELLKSHPFGVGTGDTTPELVKIYSAKEETYAREKNLNSHNQYLQMAAEHGWPGIICIILLVASAAINCIRSKDYVFLHLIALIAMNMMFESFLEVQAGIVFFCFWLFAGAGRNHL